MEKAISTGELFSLNNRVAIVTGAAKGNGRAIAEGFLNAGAIVYGIDIVKGKASGIHYMMVDITRKNDLQGAVDTIHQENGTIDILINNAGIAIGGSSESYSEENWEKTYEVNLKAAFVLSQMVAKYMIQQKSGVILNITSLGAEQGFPNNPAYVASKGGLRQLTKALARDWAQYNIRVNNLTPGYIKTDMTRKSWNDLKLREERSRRMMLDRWGESEDLVGPAIFLASDAAQYITGIDLHVDGGWLAKGM